MKKKAATLLISSIFFTFFFCSGNQSPKTKEQTEEQINLLLTKYDQNIKQQQFQLCLGNLEEILQLCATFSFQQDFMMDMTDRKHFILQKLGKYDEALEVAFKLEKMSQQFKQRQSPWYYLKIADSYLGMQDIEKTIHWMEKAVYERGFKKYKYFEQEKYRRLQPVKSFQKMLRYMKDQIGLQHSAKDFNVNLLNGETFKLSSQKGKVVLIDFWNIHCAPCVKAFPELKKLFEQYNDDGLEIIGISLDTDKQKLSEFIKKHNIPWKIACSGKGWKDETATLYGINATPSTWLIDRDGILQYYNLNGEELKNAVEELIKK